MAVYSTYNTISGAKEPTEQPTTTAVEVNNQVTGITEIAEETTFPKVANEITVPTISVTIPPLHRTYRAGHNKKCLTNYAFNRFNSKLSAESEKHYKRIQRENSVL